MFIRAIRGCSLFLALSLASASASDLTILHTFTGWRDAASFKRISEYFSGQENTGGATVLRTHPNQRAGYYFLVRAANSGPALAVRINLELITATNATPRTHTFSADLKSGETVLQLGLTGTDWPDAKSNPVAWKMHFVAADGRVLATEKSYLWEKPATK